MTVLWSLPANGAVGGGWAARGVVAAGSTRQASFLWPAEATGRPHAGGRQRNWPGYRDAMAASAGSQLAAMAAVVLRTQPPGKLQRTSFFLKVK